jgi:hypothetical protein
MQRVDFARALTFAENLDFRTKLTVPGLRYAYCRRSLQAVTMAQRNRNRMPTQRIDGCSAARRHDVTPCISGRPPNPFNSVVVASRNSTVTPDMIAHGEMDFGRDFAPSIVLGMNAGARVTVLSGLHLGCFEIFRKNEIHTLGDLKGRTVGANLIQGLGERELLTIMTALVGLDPAKDFRWVIDPSLQPMDHGS